MTENRIPDPANRRRGVAAEELRRHNLGAVLEPLHLAGPMSRSSLARLTGLNRSTISHLIAELVDVGLVSEERGTSASGPGRPSSIATVQAGGAVVLAVELEVDSMAVATIGLGGHAFGRRRERHDHPRTPEQFVEQLSRIAGPLIDSLPAESPLVGVGVAVAGVVRRHDGFLHLSPNLGWSDVPLGKMIAAEVGVDRVMMANEADLGALAEYRRGGGRGSRHMIYVAGEVGVGVGIIYDAKPMLGAAGYAGEVGHTIVNPGGHTCRCGSEGCWETEVGEAALIRRLGIADPDDPSASVPAIAERARASDPATLVALEELGRWLGLGIGNLINAFNPEKVVVGGFFHELFPFIEPSMQSAAEAVALDAPWDACSIVRSSLGADALLVGAAELVLGEVIGDPTIVRSMIPATSSDSSAGG